VNQLGTGTTILTGDTFGLLGSITITRGALQLGNGTTVGIPTTNTIVDNANLIFDPKATNALQVQASITGSGSLTQIGTGTTILLGSNSYGATFVNSGTLQVGYANTNGTLGAGSITIG